MLEETIAVAFSCSMLFDGSMPGLVVGADACIDVAEDDEPLLGQRL